jgi:hypothetical protein
MDSFCSLAEQEILSRHWNVVIQKGPYHISIVFALDAKPMQRLAVKGSDTPPPSGDFVPPIAQTLVTVEIKLLPC